MAMPIVKPLKPGGKGVGALVEKPKVPTAIALRQLFTSLGPNIDWKDAKPAAAVGATRLVRQPAPNQSGDVITAYVLKRDPSRVYFEKRKLLGKVKLPPGMKVTPPPPAYFKPVYFGPVSTKG